MNIVGIIIIVVALIGGIVGGGYMHAQKEQKKEKEESIAFVDKNFTYMGFEKPLIIPIFEDGKATAMLIAELSLELVPDESLNIASKKPRLRDEFLQVFAYYSSEGKLDKDIMSPRVQAEIRRDLTRVGKNLIGETLNAVLISSLQRQDL